MKQPGSSVSATIACNEYQGCIRGCVVISSSVFVQNAIIALALVFYLLLHV